MIREALVWLDEADPTTTRERVIADDPYKGDLAELLDVWCEALGGKSATLAEIAEAISKNPDGKIASLHNALASRTFKGTFNTRSVGRYLSKQKDRVVGGRFLQCVDDPSGVNRYQLIYTQQEPDIEPPF